MSGQAVLVPLPSRPLLFVEVATTGPDPILNEVIELAAVRAHPTLLFLLGEQSTRVRPRFPERCGIEAASRVGFDPELWDDAPDGNAALSRFSALAEGCVLAGHNITATKAFLDSAFRRAGLLWPSIAPHVVDTASLAWPLVASGVVDSLSLAAVSAAVGLGTDETPTVRRDVARTMEVYRRLMGGRVAGVSCPPAFEGDEDALLATLAARLAEGTHTYGPWRVDDGRNNPGEALLEVLDALNHCAAELVRLARAKGETGVRG